MSSVYRLELREYVAPWLGLPRLGRHVVHDSRSRQFPIPVEGVEIRSVRHDRHAAVWDQGDTGSCTGHAMAGALVTSPVWEPLDEVVVVDHQTAVDLYSDATKLDDVRGVWPPKDTGSSGLAVCKAAQRRGWISGYQWAFGLDHALRAAVDGPVLLGIGWYSSFDTPDPVTGELFIAQSADVRGGHEIVVDEVDTERRRVGFTNSWGYEWGHDGRGYLPWDVLERLLEEHGDVVRPVPLSQDPPVPVAPGGACPWMRSTLAGLREQHR